MTFKRLKWSLNCFNMKYALIIVKICPQKNFWAKRITEWGFRGGPKIVKMLKNTCFWSPLKPHSVILLVQKRSCLVRSPEASESILKNMHYHTVIFGLPMDSLKWFWPIVLISHETFEYWAIQSSFSKKGIKKRKTQF